MNPSIHPSRTPISFHRLPPSLLLQLISPSSYSVAEQLKQNPLTDDKNVAALQGGIAEGVGGQLSSGGLLGGVGDMSSKEGMNRVERGELDPSQLEEIQKKEKEQKGWTETLSAGYLGGEKK